MKELPDIDRALIEHGVRPSRQRRAICEFIARNKTHPTAEDVYRGLYKKIKTLSRTTVYNTLRLFCEKGLAQMVTLEEIEMRFDSTTQPHGHFKCSVCGKIFDFPCEESFEAAMENLPEGFVRREAQLYIHGVCKNCA